MILENLKYSFRTLRRSPGITTVAVLALTLGIGANTALFTVINAVLLRPLAYPHPDRIVELVRHWPGFENRATTSAKFAFWQRENHCFEAVAAHSFTTGGLNLTGIGEPQRLSVLGTSAGYFRVFGIQPLLGRTYSAAEDKPGAGEYAVLSYSLWHRLFNSDHHILGKTLTLSNASYQVLGVMPPEFDTAQHPDLWAPLHLNIDPSNRSNNYCVIARLKPGVSLTRAQQDLATVASNFRKTFGSDLIADRETVSAVPYHDFLVGNARQPLSILLAAVGLLLLVACANVANLLLVRSATRQREIAVRVALGASSMQIVSQLLTESFLLALAGALCGCYVATLSLPLLLRLAPPDLPQIAGATLDTSVLLFTFSVALITGVAFGLFPALQSARFGLAQPLRGTASRTTTHSAATRVRQILVIAEVAISLLLLIGASLLVKTLANLSAVRPGFDPHNVLTLEMSLDGRYLSSASVAALNARVAQRLESLPGVISAASTDALPLYPHIDFPFEITGRPSKPDDDELYRSVSPRYFSTLAVPLIAGRDFTEQDSAQSSPVLIVNSAFAAKYFPRQSPIGQQVVIGRIVGPAFADRARHIVGVVGSTRDAGLDQPAPPEMFVPQSQVPEAITFLFNGALPVHWVVRTATDPMALSEPIRRAALTVAAGLPMAEPRPLDSVISNALARQRFLMILLSVFASITLLLGTIGLYSVISYSVAQRTRELGIRSALGAGRNQLLQLVLAEGMRLIAYGVAVGLLCAFALTRFLQSLLYGVSPSQPALLIGMTLFLSAIALAACFLPARRASRIDPVIALNLE